MAIGTKKQIKKGKAWSLLTRKKGSDTVNLMKKGIWKGNARKREVTFGPETGQAVSQSGQ